MGLFDKLKPKWKNKDPNIRIEAINEMRYGDKDTFVKIIENDENPQVITKAIEKCHELYNPEFGDERPFYFNLIDNINDNSRLLLIVYSRCYKEFYLIPRLAVANVNDESILMDIANDDKLNNRIRERAIEKIDNETLLMDIANDDKLDNRIRIRAIEKIDNETLLIDLAKNDPDREVRQSSVKRINNEEILVDIAINDEDENVRRDAINSISNEKILIDIFKKDSNWEVRQKIILNLKDSDLFFSEITDAQNYIDLCDEKYYVRDDAVKRCTDVDALKWIAEHDPHYYPTEYDSARDEYVSFKHPVSETAKERLKQLSYE